MSTSSLDMNSFPFLSLSATLTQRNEYLFLFSSLVSGAAAKLPCKDALENTDIENKVGEILLMNTPYVECPCPHLAMK